MESKADEVHWDGQNLWVAAVSPVNIALVKYWGKVDEQLIIPLNSSISMTLSPEDLCSTTTVYLSKSTGEQTNTLFLNEEQHEFTKRIQNMLSTIKQSVAETLEAVDSSTGERIVFSKEDLLGMSLKIVSNNNFPTASGVASSSSGLSCLAMCLSRIYGCGLDKTEISRLARMGSGSACRSLFGGFVMWDRGFEDIKELETDKAKVDKQSRAIQLFDELHWPDLCCLICIADDKRKDMPSTDGMKTTVETSPFIQLREKEVVPKHIREIKIALEEKNWSNLAEIIMRESNSLHSVCLDTFPPIFYMNETTKAIISLVHELNRHHSEPVAAYTVDAGANCFLITKQAYVDSLLKILMQLANLTSEDVNNYSLVESQNYEVFKSSEELESKLNSRFKDRIQLKRIIVTKVGHGISFKS